MLAQALALLMTARPLQPSELAIDRLKPAPPEAQLQAAIDTVTEIEGIDCQRMYDGCKRDIGSAHGWR